MKHYHHLFNSTGLISTSRICRILETLSQMLCSCQSCHRQHCSTFCVITIPFSMFLFTLYCLNAVLIANFFLRDDICLKMIIHAKIPSLQTRGDVKFCFSLFAVFVFRGIEQLFCFAIHILFHTVLVIPVLHKSKSSLK